MSTVNNEQLEEAEAILAIYDGDNNFTKVSDDTYHYKYGIEGDAKTFLLEIKWPEEYPDSSPKFNLDVFYNNHIPKAIKSVILNQLNSEVENNLGSPMTFTLFEWMRENIDELLIESQLSNLDLDSNICKEEKEDEGVSEKKEKKENLTKSQKRREWDRTNSKGEKERGWNWVDVVRHLSQSGGQQSTPTSNNESSLLELS